MVYECFLNVRIFDKWKGPVMSSLSHVIFNSSNWSEQGVEYVSRVTNYGSKQLVRSSLTEVSHGRLPPFTKRKRLLVCYTTQAC